jgi:outer membrane protein OmpA-like peptidoglycan-associated protein
MERNGDMKKLMIIVTIIGLIGCAGPEKELKMTEGSTAKSGESTAAAPRTIVFPNGTIFGGASTEQMGKLAGMFVDSHNAAMVRMDDAAQKQDAATKSLTEGQKQIQQSTQRIEDSLQKNQEVGQRTLETGQKNLETAQKNLETAQQILKMIEQISQRQGSGEITLFFDSGSARLANGSPEMTRLVGFLDFLARESRGRKVLIVSIGSASSTGSAKTNKKLAQQRSECPRPLIEKYLVNVPHEFYKVFGIGDLYSPRDIPRTKHKQYQHTRVVAYYDTDQFPKLPEEPAKP